MSVSEATSYQSSPRSTTHGSTSGFTSPILYRAETGQSLSAHALGLSTVASFARGAHPNTNETYAYEPDTSYQKVDKLEPSQIQEIVGLLKVKTSMLAMGACERIKKTAKVYPMEIIQSPILAELITIIKDGPATPLAGASMSAMSTLALAPEGRQQICLQGGVVPLIKLIQRADLTKPNTEKSVALMMNLAADQHNRRIIREAGGVEALVALMKVAPMEAVMEHALGALHNVMLTDGKAKVRAVDAGIAYALARVLGSRLDEGHKISVRVRMVISDLLRIPDMQERLHAAATEMGIRIPGMPGYNASRRFTDSNTLTTRSSKGDVDSRGSPEPSPGVGQEGVLGRIAEQEGQPDQEGEAPPRDADQEVALEQAGQEEEQ
mmetsp:Transcript_12423/g.26835  ORF Transcript_12423/g.26835 Transcript_12423/m.26835 type:complete len:380 (+) Transcript_12423:336-1475(+)|eukprot:CAMPEP_0202921104 /NCGR_PEP_ID=MMETSP1392-20130828/77216_1 /ASSEMBLY_ACC=CAM_ASM_000868 /TAXON_ID=225041 /ORGANISM="Chlamydomonas chlamydogama, Strain SAG 11-48b" /LENGTH=379 /DNA_ID=CAMNT_0049614651 /DNA_START=238 /DNA_END=1377 /DNA_ORIENTATION=-